MSARWLVAVLGMWLALVAGTADAAAERQRRYRVELVTIGPGDLLLTRAGHAALVVYEIWPDGREFSVGYNYGDADFDDPALAWKFAFGTPRFFVSVTGDLYATVERYGLSQNRDVWGQKLALTDDQARAIAEYLKDAVEVENREYDYHYLEHTCTTELRDLLDDVLGGTIRAQLGDRTDPWTIREYQQLTFDGDWVMPLLADAVFGRRHDEPIDMYYAMMWPRRMREYLQQVQVPDPAGSGEMVPLAGEPVVLAERGGPPATVEPTKLTYWFSPIAGLLVLGGALWLRGRVPSRAGGLWLMAWSLPIGLVGLAITVLGTVGAVPELHDNELVLSLLCTDLVLVPVGFAWLHGRQTWPRWLSRYATIRLVVVGAAVLARATGLFYQEPWVIGPASLLCGIGFWWVVRAGPRDPKKPT